MARTTTTKPLTYLLNQAVKALYSCINRTKAFIYINIRALFTMLPPQLVIDTALCLIIHITEMNLPSYSRWLGTKNVCCWNDEYPYSLLLEQAWHALRIDLVAKTVTSDRRFCCVLISLSEYNFVIGSKSERTYAGMLSSYMTIPQFERLFCWKFILRQISLSLISIHIGKALEFSNECKFS